MSLPFETGPDDEQLTRYVLALLPDAEIERLDEASIVDTEVASRLRIVENDLIDSYVRGTLTGEVLERFESYYLSSPRRREHVRFATRFVGAVDRAAARADATDGGVAVEGSTPEDGAGPAPARSRFAWMPSSSKLTSLAAVLLVACGALLFQAMKLRTGLNDARSERMALDRRTHELEQQLDDQRAANGAITKELERARQSEARTSEPQAPRPDAHNSAALHAPAIALVLLPPTRAIGPVPTLAVPAGAVRVAFELRLESSDFSRYQVGLKDPVTNRVVWRSAWVAARTSGAQPSISVAVPAAQLRPQHYSLDVSGRGANGRAEIVGGYAFQIVP
jgi:hypothetical protein